MAATLASVMMCVMIALTCFLVGVIIYILRDSNKPKYPVIGTLVIDTVLLKDGAHPRWSLELDDDKPMSAVSNMDKVIFRVKDTGEAVIDLRKEKE